MTLMTIAALAAKYPVSKSTLYAACRDGMIPHYRVPSRKRDGKARSAGKYLIDEADFLNWLRGNRVEGQGSQPPSQPPPSSSRGEPFSELDPKRLAKAWKS